MRQSLLALIAIVTVGLSTALYSTERSWHSVQAADEPPTARQIPDTPLGRQLTWAFAQVNGGAATLTAADVSTHFTPGFLELFPAEQLIAALQESAAAGPFVFQGFTRPPTETQANALTAGKRGEMLVLEIAVEAAVPHRISGLNVRPVPTAPGVQLEPVSQTGSASDRMDGLFDIGGRRLYLSCVGTGSPTVVLESGLGDAAAPWFAIERGVAQFTQVCSYDRANANAGASDPAPTPRTAEDTVADLHALLTVARVPGPYVLVGHSIGGLFVRLYASTYPDEVAGLVLVDSSHEEQDAALQALLSTELWERFRQMIAQAPNPEGVDLAASFNQMRMARSAAPLRLMPLAVLAAGQPMDSSLFPPDWPAEEQAQLDRALQADLAALVPGSTLVIAEQSGHYIHQTEPGLVVDAIRQVVEAVRQQRQAAALGA